MSQSAEQRWRVRYNLGPVECSTEWSPDFAEIENLAEQLRREDGRHNVEIERREREVPTA